MITGEFLRNRIQRADFDEVSGRALLVPGL